MEVNKMPQQLGAPGVYVEEIPSGRRVIRSVATSVEHGRVLGVYSGRIFASVPSLFETGTADCRKGRARNSRIHELGPGPREESKENVGHKEQW